MYAYEYSYMKHYAVILLGFEFGNHSYMCRFNMALVGVTSSLSHSSEAASTNVRHRCENDVNRDFNHTQISVYKMKIHMQHGYTKRSSFDKVFFVNFSMLVKKTV